MLPRGFSGVNGSVDVLGRTFLYLFLRFSSDESGRDLTELCGTVCEGEKGRWGDGEMGRRGDEWTVYTIIYYLLSSYQKNRHTSRHKCVRHIGSCIR